MDAIATRRDLYDLALPPGTLGPRGRLLSTALASTNVCELDEHGFETDDPIRFRATAGGALPAPLAEGVTFYAERVSDSAFKVRASAGGAPIDFTTDGASVVVFRDWEATIDRLLERFTAMVVGMTPAHAIPSAPPYPIEMVAAVCELTAYRLQLMTGTVSGTMREVEIGARKALERYAAGVPVRDTSAPTATNLAVAVAASSSDPRGWGTGRLP